MSTFEIYQALHVAVDASDITLLRALQNKFTVFGGRVPEKSRDTCRAILKFHRNMRAHIVEWRKEVS
jgi:hypothetical protein